MNTSTLSVATERRADRVTYRLYDGNMDSITRRWLSVYSPLDIHDTDDAALCAELSLQPLAKPHYCSLAPYNRCCKNGFHLDDSEVAYVEAIYEVFAPLSNTVIEQVTYLFSVSEVRAHGTTVQFLHPVD